MMGADAPIFISSINDVSTQLPSLMQTAYSKSKQYGWDKMTIQPKHRQSFNSQQLFLSLSPLILDTNIVMQIEKSLGLSFISEQQPHRVCFANQNAELQDAYKQVFTAIDLLDYVYAIVISEKENFTQIDLHHADLAPIPYPTDNLAFWKLVNIGQRYRLSLN